ncbi:hypothetical protein BDC45DRAFT_535958 [Circinella umbellata]|nr:hypothetical protein BDC45DRAFT_535958 [Circinella umbellata]
MCADTDNINIINIYLLLLSEFVIIVACNDTYCISANATPINFLVWYYTMLLNSLNSNILTLLRQWPHPRVTFINNSCDLMILDINSFENTRVYCRQWWLRVQIHTAD